MPASRRLRAMTLAPRSWPSRPGLATTMRMGRSILPSLRHFDRALAFDAGFSAAGLAEPRPSPSGPRRLPQEVAGDNHPLDLAGALVDLGDLGVAVEPLGR